MTALTQEKNTPTTDGQPSTSRLCEALSIDFRDPDRLIASLPFSGKDATAGVENEFQTVVRGSSDAVDLPRWIRTSNYFKNLLKRARTGDNETSLPGRLRNFLEHNPKSIWENSWVRFHLSRLSPYARLVFDRDLQADKNDPDSPPRSDRDSFFIQDDNEAMIRIPVSYLLKLALSDIIGSKPDAHSVITVTGEALLHHFLSDNTSPEILSFYTSGHNRSESLGDAVAGETLKRFLLTQVITQYANRAFGLCESGQRVYTYFSAHPPIRQKQLNDMVPDAFYRELFMSPCLSGWDRGEEKKRYMGLCHRVLSRSRLNAVSKLREAGIITRNLVVLPNMSNISLANNGTHVSLGSLKLSSLLEDDNSGFTAEQEKHLGDLVIKITEHFLPLFVNAYSAAPYRLAFQDFHPENVLAFLPHQLDFTHLRMIWRRWKKKASLKIMGRTVTPFGPEWLDQTVSRLFGLKGDLVPDYRLIDYFACLMSSDQSPSLNGVMDNELRLKKDLADMGIFDMRMPLYQLYRLRKHRDLGFSGFEGRFYSVFHSIKEDLAQAVNLQLLITALSYQYILTGQVSHKDIPDDPFTESERRQIFFGRAIGIPTFYVRTDSQNTFLLKILNQAKNTRPSRRYPRYTRVTQPEYQKALFRIIRQDAEPLIRELGLEKTMVDLEARVSKPATQSVSARLTRGILSHISASGKKALKNPMHMRADEFNSHAEDYFREGLRKKHMAEALAHVKPLFENLELWIAYREPSYREAVVSVLGDEAPSDFFKRIEGPLLDERIETRDLRALARLLIFQIHFDLKKQNNRKKAPPKSPQHPTRFKTV